MFNSKVIQGNNFVMKAPKDATNSNKNTFASFLQNISNRASSDQQRLAKGLKEIFDHRKKQIQNASAETRNFLQSCYQYVLSKKTPKGEIVEYDLEAIDLEMLQEEYCCPPDVLPYSTLVFLAEAMQLKLENKKKETIIKALNELGFSNIRIDEFINSVIKPYFLMK